MKIFKHLPSGIPLPILFGPLKGCLWLSGSAAGEGKGLSILLNGSEPTQLQRIADRSEKKKIAFDIGANVGLFTLLFSKRCESVYAFEPAPRNISYLFRTLAINNSANCKIVPVALGNVNSCSFFAEGNNCAEGRIDKSGSQPVSVMTLDAFCLKLKIYPNIIKIDVEGNELNVLKGAKMTLKFKPDLFISFHSDELRRQSFALLKSYGYTKFQNIKEVGHHNSSEYHIS